MTIMAPPQMGQGRRAFVSSGSSLARLIQCPVGLRFCIEQAPDLFDPVAADTVGEEACVADAVEAGGQDVDQEPADELVRGQAHDLHAIAALDPVVLPAERHGARHRR